VLRGVAASEQARLVVIDASHGEASRPPLSSGVAAQLPRVTPCPVVVVPAEATATLSDAGRPDARRAA
jgi:hypothetical protein